MIYYKEKGIGLHQKILANGYRFECIDGEWVADDEIAVQAIIDNYSLSEAMESFCFNVDLIASDLRQRFLSAAYPILSDAERAAWPIKYDQACKYLNGIVGNYTCLHNESIASGDTLTQCAQRIKTKAEIMLAFESSVAGVARKHKSSLRAFDNFTDLYL